jgi:Holliday junction DNA helicase RuvA
MIAHLRGQVLEKSPGRVVLDCAGVGYEAAVSIPTFAALPEPGATVALFIHTHVREDQLALYGFSSINEKRLFEKLLGISGVGPRLALTILSGLEPDRLIAAIRSSVTLELKDKLEHLAGGAPIVSAATGGAVGGDVLSALENLGYPRAAAEKAVAKVLEQDPSAGDLEFEALFRAAMAAVR